MASVKNTDDGIAPTEDDMLDIMKRDCLNCYQLWDETELIQFTRMRNDKLIWWHTRHCNKRNK